MLIESLVTGVGVAAAGYFSTRYAWWRRPVPHTRPRVLMYHQVREHRAGARFYKLRVPPKLFRRQIAWLCRHGFQFVHASELFTARSLPPKTVCITFDDGYADNLAHADAILAEHGAVATLYLVAERDGGWSSRKKAHHLDEELRSEPKLSDTQVRTMLDSGRWELGGHTRTHANLPALSAAEAMDEIAAPRHHFEKTFGAVSATFAYPFGLFNHEHAAMVAQAGYIGAVTTDAGIARHPYDDPMRVPRIKVSGKDGMLGFMMRIRGGRRGLLK